MRHQHRLLIFLLLVGFGSETGMADLSDSDSMDQETTSQMGGNADEGSDYTDVNINTPREGHMGFQGRMIPEFPNGRNNKGSKPNQGRSSSKTNQAKQDQGTEVSQYHIFNMTVQAIMQMGIIVGVAILMMSLFMGMVGRDPDGEGHGEVQADVQQARTLARHRETSSGRTCRQVLQIQMTAGGPEFHGEGTKMLSRPVGAAQKYQIYYHDVMIVS